MGYVNPIPMKPPIIRLPFLVSITLACLLLPAASNAQGRLVINEFMAWPANSCPISSEFIELKNMGPGPMNIGCYVITDGDFAITIPANMETPQLKVWVALSMRSFSSLNFCMEGTTLHPFSSSQKPRASMTR